MAAPEVQFLAMVKFDVAISKTSAESHLVREFDFTHDAIALPITTFMTAKQIKDAKIDYVDTVSGVYDVMQIYIQWNENAPATSLLEDMTELQVRDALELLRLRQAAGVDCIRVCCDA
jgi:hypothetical protein